MRGEQACLHAALISVSIENIVHWRESRQAMPVAALTLFCQGFALLGSVVSVLSYDISGR